MIRSFPIRVAGNSGVLPNEIDWETITRESGSKIPIIEYTSVTKAVRRVARFDPNVVVNAIAANRPTKIVLNHLDYVDASCSSLNSLSEKTVSFVRNLTMLDLRNLVIVAFTIPVLLRIIDTNFQDFNTGSLANLTLSSYD